MNLLRAGCFQLVQSSLDCNIQTNIIKRHRAQVINHLSGFIDDLPEILDHLIEFQFTPDRIHIHQFTAQFCHVNHCRKILYGTVMKFTRNTLSLILLRFKERRMVPFFLKCISATLACSICLCLL